MMMMMMMMIYDIQTTCMQWWSTDYSRGRWSIMLRALWSYNV